MWSSARKTRRAAPTVSRHLVMEALEGRAQPGCGFEWLFIAPGGLLAAPDRWERDAGPGEVWSQAHEPFRAVSVEMLELDSRAAEQPGLPSAVRDLDIVVETPFPSAPVVFPSVGMDFRAEESAAHGQFVVGLAPRGDSTPVPATPAPPASATSDRLLSTPAETATPSIAQPVQSPADAPPVFVVASGTAATAVSSVGRPGGAPIDAPPSTSTDAELAAASRGILIQFKPGHDGASRAAVRGRVGGTLNEVILTGPMRAAGRGALEVVDLPAGASIKAALAAARANPAVAVAEPNWILTHQSTSNDPYYTNGSLWGMHGDDPVVSPTVAPNPYGSQAEEAWAAGHTGSNTVYVGVIDEGIDFSHPDLAANIWTNPFDPAGGGDNDGNGYVDDIHGWDFANKDNTVYDKGADEHGTHVAGTIGARGGNGAGVAGVSWDVKLISAKFHGRQSGTIADVIKALDYLTDLKVRHGLNIVATNNSWRGGGGELLLDAISRGAQHDILFIKAAGNSGLNNDLNAFQNYDTTSRAGYNAVIAVASIDRAGNLASDSNYGATSVELGAPGVDVYSTLPAKKYGSKSGTSMATPHVTGAAVLYASTHSGATAAQIKQAILDSAIATPTPSLSGKTVTGGRLNVSGF